jgi:tetratricopeptide (TPR) repeat protein
VSDKALQDSGGLSAQYRTYARQKCFVAYSKGSPWTPDLLDACSEVLKQPDIDLELDSADRNFDSDVPLRQKALELIANARYGIYDLSWWRDEQGRRHPPRNVYIELGMAIALNRPTLLLRHVSNRDLELPDCLKGMGGLVVEFSGMATLKDELKTQLRPWLNSSPEHDWLSHDCIPGNRKQCEYREAHPRACQRGLDTMRCHVSDGPDLDRPDFRALIDDVLGRFSDVTHTHLDALPRVKGYDFLLCTNCQTVRSTPFAIYRITPHTPAETFIAIGMSLALEHQFQYSIPKLLLIEKVADLPSLLTGFEVVEAASDRERKERLLRFIPAVLQKVRETAWKPRQLPFIEPLREHDPDAAEAADVSEEDVLLLLESSREFLRQNRPDLAAEAYRRAVGKSSAGLDVLMEFGRAFFDAGRLVEAEKILSEGLALAPRDTQLITLLGQTYLALGEYDRAGNLFDEALDLDLSQLAAWLGLAEVLEHDERLREAATCYQHVLTFSSDGGIQSKLRELQSRLPEPLDQKPLSTPIPTRRYKIRLYDLAKELKIESKRLIEEVRREGVEISVPSNTISNELAQKLRERHRPSSKRPRYRSKEQTIRVVKKAGGTKIVTSPAYKPLIEYTPLSATIFERLASVTLPVVSRPSSPARTKSSQRQTEPARSKKVPAPSTAQSTRPSNTIGRVVRLVRREEAETPAAARPQTQDVLTLYLTSRVAGAGEHGEPELLISVAPHPHRAAQNEIQLTRVEAAKLVGLSKKKLKRNLSYRMNVKAVRERCALQTQGDLVIADDVIEAIRRLGA